MGLDRYDINLIILDLVYADTKSNLDTPIRLLIDYGFLNWVLNAALFNNNSNISTVKLSRN